MTQSIVEIQNQLAQRIITGEEANRQIIDSFIPQVHALVAQQS